MKRFAVVGDPVAHSRSPAIHQAFAKALSIELQYTAEQVDRAEFAEWVAAFFADGGSGLNITLPHKAAAFDLAASRSPAAQLAGAVNTLSLRDGVIHGDNTDGSGLLRDLRRLGIDPAGCRVLVIGAGGAARGVLQPLLESGPSELVWSSRNPWIVEEIAPKFAEHGPIRPCTNLALKGDQFDLLINATSAGLSGFAPMLSGGICAENAVAYDLSYGAAAGPFLEWARSQGAVQLHAGQGMLIEQAAVSFELWNGRAPDTAPLHQAFAAGD